MKILAYLLCTVLLIGSSVSTAHCAAPKMRPYAGIGILVLPSAPNPPADAPSLYEEPALNRLGDLDSAKAPALDWIFGNSSATHLLIVTARKGAWLRVAYDDAGREGWLKPPRQMSFQTWDLFLKGNVSYILPGLQKKFYQMYQEPGSGAATELTARQQFKVLQLEDDWAMVLIDQSTLGWLRWRDEDGRLVIGIVSEQRVQQL